MDSALLTARGEYKTPGGKLIAVEFSVEEGMIRNVSVTGDFFLYPEEALPRLAAALEGQPAQLEAHAYAALIQPVLDSGVELLGSSSSALASAVMRALDAINGDEADNRR
jgi:lipoate-protein ligase A